MAEIQRSAEMAVALIYAWEVTGLSLSLEPDIITGFSSFTPYIHSHSSIVS